MFKKLTSTAQAAVKTVQAKVEEAGQNSTKTDPRLSDKAQQNLPCLPSTAKLELIENECRRLVKEQVETCRAAGKKYTDTEWAYDDMLWLDPSEALPDEVMQHPTHYVRLQYMCKEPVLFEGSNDPGEVAQGGLGTCFLMGAVSVVGMVGTLVDDLFVEYDTEVGIYGIRFYINGDWTFVIIDDFLPARACQKEDGYYPIYAECSNRHEMWVPLLEKAYAKAYGAYSHLDGGVLRFALMDLTGGVVSKLDVQTEHQVRPMSLWCTGTENCGGDHLGGRLSASRGTGVERDATKFDSFNWPDEDTLKRITQIELQKWRWKKRRTEADPGYFSKTYNNQKGLQAWWPLMGTDFVGVYCYVTFEDEWGLTGGGFDRIRRETKMTELDFQIAGSFDHENNFEFEKTYTGELGELVESAVYKGKLEFIKGGTADGASLQQKAMGAFDFLADLATPASSIGLLNDRDMFQLVGTYEFTWKSEGDGRRNIKGQPFRLISLYTPKHMPHESLPAAIVRLLGADSNAEKSGVMEKFKKKQTIAKTILTVAIENPDAGSEEPTPEGLLQNHAYGVTGIVHREDLKLIRIQNPHGNTSWRGDWSADSGNWTNSLKELVPDYNAKDEGTFYMSLTEFIQKWTTLEGCRLLTPNLNASHFVGQFSPGGLCGGAERWWENPQYLLTITQPMEIMIVLSQVNTKVYTGEDEYDIAIGFKIVQHASSTVALTGHQGRLVFEQVPEYDRQACAVFAITPSDVDTFHLILTTENVEVSLPYALTIYSDKPFSASQFFAGLECSGCGSEVITGYKCDECYEVALCESCHAKTALPEQYKKNFRYNKLQWIDATPKRLVELGHKGTHRVSRIMDDVAHCVKCDQQLRGYGRVDIADGRSDHYCWECSNKEIVARGMVVKSPKTPTISMFSAKPEQCASFIQMYSEKEPSAYKTVLIAKKKKQNILLNPFQVCVYGLSCFTCGMYCPLGQVSACSICSARALCYNCASFLNGPYGFHDGHALRNTFGVRVEWVSENDRAAALLVCAHYDEQGAGAGADRALPLPSEPGPSVHSSEDSEEDEAEHDDGDIGDEHESSVQQKFCSRDHPLEFVEDEKDWECACESSGTGFYYHCATCDESLCPACVDRASMPTRVVVDLAPHAQRVSEAINQEVNLYQDWFEECRPAVLEQLLYAELLEEIDDGEWTVARDEEGRLFFHDFAVGKSQWPPPPALEKLLREVDPDDLAEFVVGAVIKLQGRNVKARGRNVKARGRNVKARGRNVKARGRNVKARGRNVKSRGRNVKARGRNVKARGRNVKARGRLTKSRGRQVKARGRQVKARGRQVKTRGRQVKTRGRQVKVRGSNLQKVRGASVKTDLDKRSEVALAAIEAVPARLQNLALRQDSLDLLLDETALEEDEEARLAREREAAALAEVLAQSATLGTSQSSKKAEDTQKKSTKKAADTKEKSTKKAEDTKEKSTKKAEDTKEKSTKKADDTKEKSTKKAEDTKMSSAAESKVKKDEPKKSVKSSTCVLL